MPLFFSFIYLHEAFTLKRSVSEDFTDIRYLFSVEIPELLFITRIRIRMCMYHVYDGIKLYEFEPKTTAVSVKKAKASPQMACKPS